MAPAKILQTENSRTLLTVSEKLESEPTVFNQFLASALASLSALCLGMCLVWTSPALPMIEHSNSTLTVTTNQGAWIGSLLTLGACLGAIPAGPLTNMIGRKRTLQLMAIPLLLSWGIIGYGNRVVALYIGRFLAGLAVGGVSVAAPMYVAEIAHPSIRGTLGTFFQVFITVGVLLEYTLGGTVPSFFLLALTSSFLPLIFLIMFSFMPETPMYLYSKNRVSEAKRALQYLRGQHFNVDEELLKIAEEIKEARANKTKILDLFKSRATTSALAVSLGLMACQQLSGINAVLFYAANIFAETGSSMKPDSCAILVGLVQVLATLLSTLLIDKTGRKILLFLSSFVMSISLVFLGTYFILKQTHNLSFLSFVPLASLTIFIIVFSVGLGPIPWIMLGEIFSPKTKGVASSVSASANWILAFTVTNQYQTLSESLGMGMTFIAFGVICAVGAVFVALLVPETKGRDVDEVQRILLRNRFLVCNRVRTTDV